MKTLLCRPNRQRCGWPHAVVLVLALYGAHPAHAQLPEARVNGQSPNVAALVNAHSAAAAPFTGTVSVAVPLYTLQVGEVSLPIGLRYASQGFKPEEQAGWLGMGWSLEAGGVISRTVQDLPDELTFHSAPQAWCNVLAGYTHSPMRYAGFFWMPYWRDADRTNWFNGIAYGSQQDIWKIGERDVLLAPGCHGNDLTKPIEGLDNLLDTEPDEFSFTAPGLSGRFMLAKDLTPAPANGSAPPDQNSRWQIQCDRNVRVELITQGRYDDFLIQEPWLLRRQFGLYTTWPSHRNRTQDTQQPRMFRGFKLTIDDGTRYYFGNDSLAIDYSVPIFQQTSNYWTASAWHLTRIEYPNGQIIDFGYRPPNGYYYTPQFARAQLTNQFFHSGRTITKLKRGNHEYTRDAQSGLSPWNNVEGQVVWSNYLTSIRERASGATVQLAQIRDPNSVGYPSTHWFDIFIAAQNRTCPPNAGPGPPCIVTGPGGSGARGGNTPQLGRIRVFAPPVPSLAPVAGGADTIGALIREFEFAYKATPGERRQLLGVTEIGAGGERARPYQFTYYPNPARDGQGNPLPLPEAFDGKSDHWGFYNGPNGIGFHAPLPPDAPGDTSNLAIARMGMLQRLTSPLGEITQFAYERHRYRWIYDRQFDPNIRSRAPVVPDSGVAGGVRLRSVTRRAGTRSSIPARTVRYTYKTSKGFSSGILAGEPVYYFKNYEVRSVPPVLAGQFQLDTLPDYNAELDSYHSLLPTINGAGAHVCYSYITEHYDDGSRKRAAYSNYTFTPLDDSTDRDQPDGTDQRLEGGVAEQNTPAGPYAVQDDRRGKLLQETWYTPDATQPTGLRRVRQRTLRYRYAPHPSHDPRRIGAQGLRITNTLFTATLGTTNTLAYRILEGGVSMFPTNSLLLAAEEITTEEPGFPRHTTKRWIKYNSKFQVIRETTFDTARTSDSLSTRYLYPSSPSVLGQPVQPWLSNMQSARQWRYPLKVVQSRGPAIIGITANKYTSNGFAISATASSVQQSTLTAPLSATAYAPWMTRLDDPATANMRTVRGSGATTGLTLPRDVSSSNGPPMAYWWDKRTRDLTAVARNAFAGQVAVEDFEDAHEGVNIFSQRGWTIEGTDWHLSPEAHTGRFSLVPPPLPPYVGTPNRPGLPGHDSLGLPMQDTVIHNPQPCYTQYVDPNGSHPIDPYDPFYQRNGFWAISARPNLNLLASDSIAEFILSFWARPADITVAEPAGGVGVWVNPNQCRRPWSFGVSGRQWRFYQARIRIHKVDPLLLLGGSHVLIDDLHLYPADARLTTYTYKPLVGVESVIDESNYTTRYEYDGFGRLQTVRDDDGKVLTTQEYRFRPIR